MHHRILTLFAVFLLSSTLPSSLIAVRPNDGVINDNHTTQEKDIRTDITPSPSLSRRITFSDGNGIVQGAIIAASAGIAAAVCVGTGGVACFLGALFAVETTFFSGFVLEGREYQSQHDTFLLLPPTHEKTHIQRLMTELEPGVWHTVGHSHVNSFNHTLHYFNGGSFSKLRAVQVPFINSSTLQKRVDENDQDGTVVEYAWQNENAQSFQDFPASSDELHTFATDIANYMIDQEAVALCNDFADQDGVVASGIVTLGVNDQPFDFNTIGGEQNAFAMCGSDGL